VLVDGWLRTGDVGSLDDDGFLALTDRKRDLIVLSSGKNVAPQRIERILEGRPTIGHAVVIGDRRQYLIALVTVPTDRREALGPDVRAAVRRDVDAVNEQLAPYEQLRRFAVLDEEFTTEGGDLTPTLKVRRRVIASRYQALIESLYDGGG
jgi:long-chain acyl-CoA synthetase